MDTIFIQNLISPYRSRFFNKLNLQYHDFVVYYMGETESDRNWDVSKIKMEHNHWIDKYSLYHRIKRFHIHINPFLVIKTLWHPDAKNIILAVSYNDINIMAIALAKKMHLTNKSIFFWAEANYLTNGARRESKVKDVIRRWVFSSVDGGMIIPGRMSEITFEKWNIKVKDFIYLPNTINDEDMQYSCSNDRSTNKRPVFLIPIRVNEAVKGALNFFKSIGEENIRKAEFIIAGDGEDYEMYQQYIARNKLDDYIKMVGFCNPSQMRDLYNQSNVLLLPSFSDPSPLTLVEALKFHLPVLCSNHCGNHFEVVNENVNGYTFSPMNPDDIRAKYELILSRKNDWTQMGEVSYRLYQEKFETNKVINSFLTQFISLKK